MPRPQRYDANNLAHAAFPHFWWRGYARTSVADLSGAGGSRQAIYAAFPDKRALFLASLDAYRATIVDPAFSPVERPNAGLSEIAGFFERHIAAAEQHGLPGPGCLLANTLVELASSDPDIAAAVQTHLDRLTAGFARALANACAGRRATEIAGWATLLTTTAQGVWAISRIATDAAALRAPVQAVLTLIQEAIACAD